jgi:hypothetical protein
MWKYSMVFFSSLQKVFSSWSLGSRSLRLRDTRDSNGIIILNILSQLVSELLYEFEENIFLGKEWPHLLVN